MKKFFAFIVIMVLPLGLYAQQTNNKVNKNQFGVELGSLIKKETYTINGAKEIPCEAIIITDLNSNVKEGFLTFGINNSVYVLTDVFKHKELENCIKALNYFKNEILPSYIPTTTEVLYTNSNGTTIGLYQNHREEWRVFINEHKVSIDAKHLDSLINSIVAGKQKLDEELKK